MCSKCGTLPPTKFVRVELRNAARMAKVLRWDKRMATEELLVTSCESS